MCGLGQFENVDGLKVERYIFCCGIVKRMGDNVAKAVEHIPEDANALTKADTLF